MATASAMIVSWSHLEVLETVCTKAIKDRKSGHLSEERSTDICMHTHTYNVHAYIGWF
jgi:hypothetical protein